jgi:hypothetical protein
VNTPTKLLRKKKIDNLYFKFLLGKLDHFTPEDRQDIQPVLRKYAHVFHDEMCNDFKEINVIEHKILVGDANPITRAAYRTPYALRDEMQTEVQNMLNKEITKPNSSPWSALAILVPKKSQDGKPKFRFCVDFKALNSVTQFDPYPLLLLEERFYGNRMLGFHR